MAAYRILLGRTARRRVMAAGVLAALAAARAAGADGAAGADAADSLPGPSIWELSLEDLLGLKVVTPSRTEERMRDAPAVVSVVTRREIDAYGAGSLADVLERVAGVYIYGSYYLPNNMITVRGEATSHYTTHILVLIDGRPWHSSKEGYFLPFLAAFPVDVVDRIEVVRGPGSALYGNTAYAGAINVITREASDLPATASAGAGSFGAGSGSLAAGFRAGPAAFTVGTTYADQEGWVREVRDADADTLYPAFRGAVPERALGLHAGATWGRARLGAFVATSRIMNGYQLQYLAGWPELNLGTTRAMVDLGWTSGVSPRHALDAHLTWNYQHYWQPFDPAARDVREYARSDDVLLEVVNHLGPFRGLRMTVGGLVSYNTGYIRNNELTREGEPFDVWSGRNPDPFEVVPDYAEAFVSGYASATWNPWERLRLVAGAHANKAPDLDVDVVPRAGAIVSLTDRIYWKTLYGEAFRSPDVFERFSRVEAIRGDSRLSPERIETWESQVGWARRDMSLAASGFYSRQDNLIARRNVEDTAGGSGAVRQRFVNEGGMESRGFELEGALHPAGLPSVNLSVTCQENETFAGVRDLFGVPNLLAKAGLAWTRPAWSAGLSVSRFDYLDVVAGYPVLYPGANAPAESFTWTTLNLRVDWKALLREPAAPRLATELYLVNLLDEAVHYPEHGRRFVNSTPGRSGFAWHARLRLGL